MRVVSSFPAPTPFQSSEARSRPGARPRIWAQFLLVLLCFSCATPPPASAPLGSTTSTELDRTSGGPGVATSAKPDPATERPEQALAKVPVSSADPQWGSVDAPVTIVEISDFECPFCARVQPTLEQLKQKYGPGRLRLVWKHNPLPFHESARPAHDAAAAVHMLGGNRAFFAFRERAFANQRALTPENLEAWAAEAGVQPSALREWLKSRRAAQKVESDMALARTLGASGTPAFRINGVTLTGAQPIERFIEIIDAQLAAAQQLTQGGTPPRLVYTSLTNKNVELSPPSAANADPGEEAETKVWNLPISPDDPVRGPQDALVTIVLFSEYQCPFCKRVEETLSELRTQYEKDVRIVWKDNPLPFHPRAEPAAALARFAFQKRGNEAFWAVHDALFDSAPALEDSDFEAIAKKQGLPWAPIAALLASDKPHAKIEESMELAAEYQARGTPHCFINGRRLAGAQPIDAFRKLIDAELEKARALVERGTPRSKVYSELMKTAESPSPPEKKHVELRADAATRGNPKAPVVIQIFSDFQCPYCRRVEPTLSELEKEQKGKLRIVWRHLPLPFHSYAQLAAEASEEVLKQKGPAAFWSYHDALFEAQGIDGGLRRENLEQLAEKQGIDGTKLRQALDTHEHRAKVQGDADAATQAGINGTPSFLINGYVLSGAQPIGAFRRLVKRALKDGAQPN
jgi:protein-disulfide isomerase